VRGGLAEACELHAASPLRDTLAAVARFPSLKAQQLLSILTSKPLCYVVVRQRGSHRRLEAEGRPALTFAFHDKATIPGGMVRKVLVSQVGLDEDEARGLL
jgi:predicted RNA binding protein YcfA (HicA-like mRNA interferase family)